MDVSDASYYIPENKGSRMGHTEIFLLNSSLDQFDNLLAQFKHNHRSSLCSNREHRMFEPTTYSHAVEHNPKDYRN